MLLELFKHSEPQGAKAFLTMLKNSMPPAGGPAEALAGSQAPGIELPRGASECSALVGAAFDCVLPSVLMAVGGMPEGAAAIIDGEGYERAALVGCSHVRGPRLPVLVMLSSCATVSFPR